MPDDLKTTLGKVLASRGRKTFAFAYVTGKRIDGKGEGHLVAVAGRKSFKKDDLAEEVNNVGVFLQGKCWADSDGKTIFFQGKGLNNILVVKMKLTAKTVTGRGFEFQLPDKDEEARQVALEAVDLEAEKNRGPAASTEGDQLDEATMSPSAAASSPPAATAPPPAASSAPPPAPPAPPAAGVAKLVPAYDALRAKVDAGLADIRKVADDLAAATPPNPTGAGGIRKWADKIQGGIVDLKDSPTAADYLETIASLEGAARAIETVAPKLATNPNVAAATAAKLGTDVTDLGAAESTDAAALSADYEALRTKIKEAVAKLRDTNPEEAREIQKLVVVAEGHAAAPNYAAATEFLKSAEKALSEVSAPGTAAPKPAAARAAAAVSTLRQDLAAARQQAITDLGQLGAKAAQVDDPDAPAVASQIQALADSLPTLLESALTELEKATQASQADRMKQFKKAAAASVKVWMDFLTAHAEAIGACEKNPLKIPVHIVQPVQKSLKAILKATA